jgi:hypothetical protein
MLVRVHVGTYTTVSAVCAPSLLGCLVDLDVLDNQVADVETLGVGVGLSVLEETEKELGGLDGPAGLGDTESLACVVVNIAPCTIVHNSNASSSGFPLFRRPDSRNSALTLRGSASAAGVSPHGDGLFVLHNIAEVGDGALKLPSVDRLGSLAGVLEGSAEVAAASAGRLLVRDLCGVTDLVRGLAGVAF